MNALQQEAKELREAIAYMEELRKDPERFQAWAGKVIDGWLKEGRRSSRRSRTSKHS
jgi:hypothetical protein